MSKTNHQRNTVSRRDAERRKQPEKRHKRNPLLGRPLTGSVHEVDYPPDGWNSRIRQREKAATRELVKDIDVA